MTRRSRSAMLRAALLAAFALSASVAQAQAPAVIDHYAAGGRAITDGPYRGVGHDNPNKTASIRGFTPTTAQRSDLIAFLRSLTDEELLKDSRFADPWPAR